MGIQTVSQAYTNEGNGSFAFKNKIINGDMSVNQRQTTFSAKGVGNSQFLLDRWGFDYNGGISGGGMTYNSSQSTDAPSGFVYSNAISIQNAFSGTIDYTGTSYFLIRQGIEGYNVQDFGWFTSGAKPVTISFWAKSSVASPCSVGFRCSIATQTYGYFTTLTFNALNTWEYKTITVPALKPAGVSASYPNGMNGTALELMFSFVGSVGASPYVGVENTWTAGNLLGSANQNSNFVKTAGASFLFTGVQLEVGSVATPFERRNVGTELGLCQRYFWRVYGQNIDICMNNQTSPYSSVTFSTLTNPVTMRASGTFAHNMTNAKNVSSTPGADQWAWYIQNQGYGSTSSGDIANLNGGGQLYCRIGAYTLAPTAASTGIRMGANIYIENSAEI